MDLILLAKSSSGTPYPVAFTLSGENVLSVRCPCAAGELEQLCKHVLALIAGDHSILFTHEEQSTHVELLGFIRACAMSADHEELQAELFAIDKEWKIAKTKMETRKRQLKAMYARKLRDGYIVLDSGGRVIP